MDLNNLEEMTLANLQKLARKHRLKGYYRLKKKELVEALKQTFKDSAAERESLQDTEKEQEKEKLLKKEGYQYG
jgi:endonuclease III-like uncharacterized protein